MNLKKNSLPVLLISLGMCLGLFLVASVGTILMCQLLLLIPATFTTPSLGLYFLALLVGGFYAWRWMSRHLGKDQVQLDGENASELSGS